VQVSGQPETRFRDRIAAGRELAARLDCYRNRDAVVLGLARGGVPVAYEVARLLELPLDVTVVRKLGVPGRTELAMGAVARGTLVLNRAVTRAAGIDSLTVRRAAEHESGRLAGLERSYRGGRDPVAVAGRTTILIDDGLATGSSMLAAVWALRDEGVRATVVAVPVAPPETCRAIAAEVERVVCVFRPRRFFSVGTWYVDFDQVSDEDVRTLVGHSWREGASREDASRESGSLSPG
jgi:predicted phosphoribosyltransferase